MKRAALFLLIILTSVIIPAQDFDYAYGDIVVGLHYEYMTRMEIYHNESPPFSMALYAAAVDYAKKMLFAQDMSHDLMTTAQKQEMINYYARLYNEPHLIDQGFEENIAWYGWIMTDITELITTWDESEVHFRSIFSPDVTAIAHAVVYGETRTYICAYVIR